MSNALMNYSSDAFTIRAYSENSEPWFIAEDVCNSLGIVNHRDAVSRLDEDEKGVVLTDTLGGQQYVTAVNEPGLYNLVLSSRKPEAKAFKRWITHDVIPAIRKNGTYSVKLPQSYAEALRELACTVEEKERLEEQNRLMAPKAEFYDAVAGSKDAIEMAHVAKVLNIKGYGRNRLFDFLREKKILDKNNIPYQKFVDSGYFRVLEQKYVVSSGETKINIKTLVYQKGLDYIRKIVSETV